MDLKEIAVKQIQSSIATKQAVLDHLLPEIVKSGQILAETLRNGNLVLFCGNGGSSCDASHIAAELVVRYKSGNERRALPAISLSADSAVLTAGGNDYGYEEIFARQVEAFGKEGDLLVGISTSGNSRNVISAVEKAKSLGMKTICFLGGDGGKLKGKSDLDLIVPSGETARVQESHILIGHILCSIVESELFQLH
ncbi:SIS domain-containing protein [Leptospira fletcheri]|uniref:Phosphoheptose isomerase n=1 Tax=Leptospira fletcheri TaxID=2484981 RepID=A0A4R9GJX9_9LEPT|nr:D-sedoheptulose 7-phosphate isomerase [Leptospira fletcheri]TGK13879.1 SIS domain-containing protein [Leptospira fletcheri]